MTYKEAYGNCKTFKELKDMVKNDISVAMLLNPDRIKNINDSCLQICKERNWCD